MKQGFPVVSSGVVTVAVSSSSGVAVSGTVSSMSCTISHGVTLSRESMSM